MGRENKKAVKKNIYGYDCNTCPSYDICLPMEFNADGAKNTNNAANENKCYVNCKLCGHAEIGSPNFYKSTGMVYLTEKIEDYTHNVAVYCSCEHGKRLKARHTGAQISVNFERACKISTYEDSAKLMKWQWLWLRYQGGFYTPCEKKEATARLMLHNYQPQKPEASQKAENEVAPLNLNAV